MNAKKSFAVGLAMLMVGTSLGWAMTVTDLRCEFRPAPLGIDSMSPRLGWKLASGQRGDVQSSYRILVASSPALLATGVGNLWDSGQVSTSAQNQIRYAGQSLTNHQQVFWKVRVWDAAGAASAWSSNATWTMGVLNSNGWVGQWITLGNADAASTLLRRGFSVGANLKRALVSVSGLGQHELSVNGQRVGTDFLSPGWTKYDKTILYDTFDVTALVSAGTNAVGIMLGNGMYNVPATARYAKFTGTFGPRKAIAQIRLEYLDGSVQMIGTDAAWKATTNGPVTFNTIYGGEDYDARRELAGWNTASFNAASWSNAVIATGPGGVLKGTSHAAPPLRTFEVFTPVNSWGRGAGNTVHDFGQNAAQIPTVTVHGSAGATVRLYPSELVDGNGDITPIVSPAYYTYTLKGSGTETFTPRFCYIGCRYLRVETRDPSGGTSGALPVVDSLSSSVISSDSSQAGTFSCSKPLFNRIRQLVKWAQRSNAVGVFTDCPQREKLGWLEQYYLHGASLRYEQDFAALFAKCATDMADSQLANGMVPDIAPEYTVFGGGFRDSPEWGSAFILSPWQQYEFYGDTELFERNYDAMKAYVNYLTSQSTGHLVNYGLGDWFDLGPGGLGEAQLTPKALTATAIYYADAKTLAKIAELVGRSADAVFYSALASNICTAFNTEFYHPLTGSYSTGSQTANSMPLVLGLVAETNRAKVTASLVSDVRARGNSLTAGDIGHEFLLRALAGAARSDVVYDIHSKTNTPGYGYILGLGATSLTEGWDGSASQNHFMLGHIMEWFYRDLAGIQLDPAAPGFANVVIKPAIVGDVTWAAAGYDSIRGLISNRWELVGNQLSMNCTIPAGMTATVYLPTLGSAVTNLTISESGTNIWQNGQPLGAAPGVAFDHLTTGAPSECFVVWRVGSGSYRFSWAVAPAPAGVSAGTYGGEVQVSWNPSLAATAYQVKRAANSGGPYQVIATGVTATHYTDTTVAIGATYYYVVSALSAFGESVDSLEVGAKADYIANAGFELPTVVTYAYGVSGAGWVFSPQVSNGGSGVSGNNSGFTLGNPVAPEGSQVAFLQGTGLVSQVVGGFVPARRYTLTFSAAQRNNIWTPQTGQTWNVTVNGAVVASFAPPQSATSYADYTTTFIAPGESFTLAFVGSNNNGGDNTVFLDNIRIAPSPAKAVYLLDGDATDSSGNANHGLASNVTFGLGKIGSLAARFNGTNAYISVPSRVTGDFSMAMWVKTTDTGGAGSQWWSGKGLLDGEVAGSAADWGTAVLNGKFAFGVGNPDTTLVSTQSLNDGQWHHVAATRQSATGLMQVYVDGVLQGSATGPSGSRTAPPGLRLGGMQTGAAVCFLNGALDDVRVFDWALSQAEVLGTMNRAPSLAAPGNYSIVAGSVLLVTNLASDPDQPGQSLTWSLPVAPAGASINATNGLVQWRPAIAQAPSTNIFKVVVADDGLPGLSATQNFTVTVTRPATPQLSAAGWSNGAFSLRITGDAGPNYLIEAATNLGGVVNWRPVATNQFAVPPWSWTDAAANGLLQRFYRVRLGP